MYILIILILLLIIIFSPFKKSSGQRLFIDFSVEKNGRTYFPKHKLKSKVKYEDLITPMRIRSIKWVDAKNSFVYGIEFFNSEEKRPLKEDVLENQLEKYWIKKRFGRFKN